jgi:ADP-heptose:LPS heptosyltransferase
MGIGDDVITLARARQLYLKTGRAHCPRDRQGRARTDRPIYQNSPYISPDGDTILEYPDNKRPYEGEIQYQAPRAEFHLRPELDAWAQQQAERPYIILNPDAKPNAHYSNNKHWYRPHWHRLIELLKKQYPEYRLVRAGYDKMQYEYDLETVTTTTVHDLIALIKYAAWLITTEGAPHHISAGTGTRTTVIYGHCTSPNTTGYQGQQALYDPQGPCNSRHPCSQCEISMRRITPEQVLDTVRL